MNKIWLEDGNTLVVRCDFDSRHVVKEVGGKWNASNKTWRLPFTSKNIEYLVDSFDEASISQDVEDAIEEQIWREKKLKKIRELAKDDKPVQLKVPGLNATLRNYQKLGVMFAVTGSNGVLIADEMGLGKTIQSIATACYKKEKEGISKCLIITPASLKWNWPLEIEKFTNEKYVVIDGPADKRVQQWLTKDVFFYVVNYELVVEDLFGGRDLTVKEDDSAATAARKTKQAKKVAIRAKKLEHMRNINWPLIVADEIHAIKNHSAKRTRCVKQLKSKFRIALSGTPVDGRLEELHSIMDFLVPGLFESKHKFLQRHAEFDFFGRVTKYKNVADVKKKIEPFFIRRLKKNVLKELPDKIYENRYIEFSPAEKKVYKQLANKGHEVTEDCEAMEICIRCKQFCDLPALVDEGVKKSSKMDDFVSVLDEIVIQNAHKAIIFSQYTTITRLLIEKIEKMNLSYLYICGDTPKKERADMQNQFNTDSKIDIMIGTDAMSTGLNFTGASYVINYDDAWSPSIMAQREDRAHRIGQKNTVTVINFVVKNTIEERIRDVLYSKAHMSAEVLGDDTDESVLKRLGPKDIAKLL